MKSWPRSGTANMDYRSLTDNLEVTAFIRGREAVRELAANFGEDLASCRRITRRSGAPAVAPDAGRRAPARVTPDVIRPKHQRLMKHLVFTLLAALVFSGAASPNA